MKKAYLLTGGNIGDRLEFLRNAKKAIAERCGRVTRHSSVYETEAWGRHDQEKFLNQALLVHTDLEPTELLDTILEIELSLGRKRDEKYGPRTIDIDIMFIDAMVLSQPKLKIPHPEMQHRRFALQCLHDIAPRKKHPLLGKTISRLLAECADPLKVHKFN